MKLLMADIKGKICLQKCGSLEKENMGVTMQRNMPDSSSLLFYFSFFPFLEKLILCHELDKKKGSSIPATGFGEPQSSSPTGGRWNLNSDEGFCIRPLPGSEMKDAKEVGGPQEGC